jgi:hypothetical protein
MMVAEDAAQRLGKLTGSVNRGSSLSLNVQREPTNAVDYLTGALRVDELHHLGAARAVTVALAESRRHNRSAASGPGGMRGGFRPGVQCLEWGRRCASRRRKPGRRGLLSGEGLLFAGAVILVVTFQHEDLALREIHHRPRLLWMEITETGRQAIV